MCCVSGISQSSKFEVLLLFHKVFQTVFFQVGAYWRRGNGTRTDEFRRSEASREYEVGTLVFLAVLRIRIRMDPHHIGKLDPDPDPHQGKSRIRILKVKGGSLRGHFEALEGPNLEKSEW
jgi:hypothetical protein